MNTTPNTEDYIFRERGVIEDADGRVAGMWVRHRKGRKEMYFFTKPIKKRRPYRLEHKTIVVDGRVMENVPVRVYPLVNSLTHWGKYAK
ncbi:MAG: hypothetical protein C4523_15035 [Myxococcales bacterium]|nr:MAG: hypothetical protein C4523_15035 [Myxococcales bacterium]